MDFATDPNIFKLVELRKKNVGLAIKRYEHKATWWSRYLLKRERKLTWSAMEVLYLIRDLDDVYILSDLVKRIDALLERG